MTVAPSHVWDSAGGWIPAQDRNDSGDESCLGFGRGGFRLKAGMTMAMSYAWGSTGGWIPAQCRNDSGDESCLGFDRWMDSGSVPE